MITIDANTKIAAILREHPAALETIVSLSPRFAQLRNPVLRKLMAARTTVAMASRIGGCTVQDFLQPLAKLGFPIGGEPNSQPGVKESESGEAGHPDLQSVITLDVRPILSAGGDPLGEILKTLGTLPKDSALKIINSFTPTPLIALLEKKGFSCWSDHLGDHLVHTWFYKKDKASNYAAATQARDAATQAPDATTHTQNAAAQTLNAAGWQTLLDRFAGKQQTIDVRELPMPLPMLTILESLDRLPRDNALFVDHKRIPVFLLPELAERGFAYRIFELSEGHLQLLIFKKEEA